MLLFLELYALFQSTGNKLIARDRKVKWRDRRELCAGVPHEHNSSHLRFLSSDWLLIDQSSRQQLSRKGQPLILLLTLYCRMQIYSYNIHMQRNKLHLLSLAPEFFSFRPRSVFSFFCLPFIFSVLVFHLYFLFRFYILYFLFFCLKFFHFLVFFLSICFSLSPCPLLSRSLVTYTISKLIK